MAPIPLPQSTERKLLLLQEHRIFSPRRTRETICVLPMPDKANDDTPPSPSVAVIATEDPPRKRVVCSKSP
ncbi:hypothetical protein CDAR_425891 [Caerostris darwini]|uniref:Uncharacterized protein n=1 Tax=Caerostris darwini TaxID=1538125 RepID=A0AAV4WL86_9ARAC|nr:hypothetical protein CDAR_425891 [Caerostris darwini]